MKLRDFFLNARELKNVTVVNLDLFDLIEDITFGNTLLVLLG
jgi:hypothetical protein